MKGERIISLFDNAQRFQTFGIRTETIHNGKFQREIYKARRRFKSFDGAMYWKPIPKAITKLLKIFVLF